MSSGSRLVLDRAELRLQVYRAARLDLNYILMNSLATVVAAYGLLANSAIAVVGAMLMAMLLGLALGLVDGDGRLLRRAAVAEVAGACLVLSLGTILGFLHRDLPITTEILARTQPNLLDLMIALAGGAAGAYSTCSPRVAAGMVGVAISTSLAPPLTACGICLSRGLLPEAGGALLLFVTNLVAIQFACSVTLAALGYHSFRRLGSDQNYWRRIALDIGLLLALAAILAGRLAETLSMYRYQDSVQRILAPWVTRFPGARLVETRYAPAGEGAWVVAVVRTPRPITSDQIAEIEPRLPQSESGRTLLRVRSVLTEESTARGAFEPSPGDGGFPADWSESPQEP